MRKFMIPAAAVATLALGGCASYGNGGLLGGLLGGGNDYGYSGGNDFERAAVKACGDEASRYGRVSINQVDEQNRDYVYVTGRIDSRNYNQDEFTCVFRSDGRVVDFQTR